MIVNVCGMGRPKCRVIPWAPSVCGCVLRVLFPPWVLPLPWACGRAFWVLPRPFPVQPLPCGRSFSPAFPLQRQLLPWACGPASLPPLLQLSPQRSLPFWLRSFSRLIGLVRCGLAGALGGHFKIQGAHGRQGDGDALLKPVHRLLWVRTALLWTAPEPPNSASSLFRISL